MPAANALIAASAQKLMMVLPDQGIAQRFDLSTGERELTTKLPLAGVVTNIAMGWDSNGPLLVRWAEGTDALSRCSIALFDPMTFAKQATASITGHSSSYRDVLHFRASGDGRLFGVWATSHTPTGLEAIKLIGAESRTSYEHNSVGHVAPAADGSRIFTAAGAFTSELKNLGGAKQAGSFFLPSASPMYYLSLGSGPNKEPLLSIVLSSSDTQLLTLNDLTELADLRVEPWQKDDFTFDKRIWFIPGLNRLVTIPATNDTVVVRELNVLAALDRSGVDYLFTVSTPPKSAARGAVYTYQLEVKAKKKVRGFSVDGPPGMSVSSSGQLRWKVPADFPDKEVAVILTVIDSAGQQAFQTFTLTVQ